MNENPDEKFLSLFEKELANRANARRIMQLMAAASEGEEYHAFWSAYLTLEEQSYRCYKPVAKRWGLSAEPTLKTRALSSVSYIGLRLFRDYMIDQVHQAVEAYMPKLRELAQRSPESSRPFFVYVVTQEKAQLEAFSALLEGNPQMAALKLSAVESLPSTEICGDGTKM